MEELLDLVDENNRVIGTARRSACHGDPRALHRAVHLLLFNRERELYLQQRSPAKQVQPGKWDTSVGGHIAAGEDYVAALFRESEEELGLTEFSPCFMYNYIMRNEFESELVGTFICVSDQLLSPNIAEISDGRFWLEEEILDFLGSSLFTPNFEDEFQRFQQWRHQYPRRFEALFTMEQGFCKEYANG